MTALYRLQTVVALTRAELNALAALVALCVLGVAAQALARPVPAPLPASEARLAVQIAGQSRVPAAALAPAVAAVKDSARASIAEEAPVAAADVAGVLPAAAASDAAAAEEAPKARRTYERKAPFTGRMNLNAATAEQLQRLPRIGEAMARRILDYRRQHGRFRSVDELNHVRGIGDKTLEKLRVHLYV